ncbi:hypothetical protein [Laceyella putida]|uniref:Uncharacterized protein n=1 Tax=Laceyella putida TaxID=110101 RepID=A0ABW2RFN4_9BACL
MRRSKRMLWLVMAVVITVPAVAVGVHQAPSLQKRLHFLKPFDLNGTLAEIEAKTKALGSLNKKILQGLQSIEEKSAKTEQVSQKLKQVNGIAGKQSETLTDIRSVTARQVLLSQSLNRLSGDLTRQMNLIANTGKVQASQGQELESVTVETLEKLKEAVKQNQRLEEKLKQAASKSEQASQSLP